MNALAFLVARLKEPSTYAGLGGLLAAIGWHLDDTLQKAAVSALIAFFGLVAILLHEGNGNPPQ